MDETVVLGEEDYLVLQRELAATARGRAFLEMHEAKSRQVARSEVAELIDELQSVMERNASRAHREADLLRVLRGEIEEISHYIEQTRREIAALRPEDDSMSWIQTARGELDAIVTATEQATYDILGAAEEVQRLVGTLPRDGSAGEARQALEAQVTAILTACSFQDITGQRTTKVVGALRFLEERVNLMIEIWGKDEGAAGAATAPRDRRVDAHLLNGPPLTGGISQDDVDALMISAPAVAAQAPSASQAEIDALFE
jgi:chemotaxis regulatin CheY-phosphate phosphatase CheZ